MTDATPGIAPGIRDEYMRLTRRKRTYNTIFIALFVALMAAGFWTADDRNAGGFFDGIHRFFDFPAEVLGEASHKLAEFPAHFVKFFPALIETLNIAAAATLTGALIAMVLSLLAVWRCGRGQFRCFGG